MTGQSPTDRGPYSKIDTSVPHSARIWNYWMGGKENYAADGVAGDACIARFPGIVELAKQSRQFVIRAVHYLAAQAGIRQVLDIGTGLPTMQTRIRSPNAPPQTPKSCTSTTTRSCSSTPAPCCATPPPRASPVSSTTTSTTPNNSYRKRATS
ncbi:hypothetical protein GCM10023170_090490 [Phytohabitans houttuyneae]|uniref:Uncharacterized protein n=1 Tax=Phytohabitans houttuyneae TaxID=1076126 RepID=A0A6V8KJY5_9ACTN|nr:hypothetical protein Phou_062370 [Phytohabitans houttuyneae]